MSSINGRPDVGFGLHRATLVGLVTAALGGIALLLAVLLARTSLQPFLAAASIFLFGLGTGARGRMRPRYRRSATRRARQAARRSRRPRDRPGHRALPGSVVALGFVFNEFDAALKASVRAWPGLPPSEIRAGKVWLGRDGRPSPASGASGLMGPSRAYFLLCMGLFSTFRI